MRERQKEKSEGEREKESRTTLKFRNNKVALHTCTHHGHIFLACSRNTWQWTDCIPCFRNKHTENKD